MGQNESHMNGDFTDKKDSFVVKIVDAFRMAEGFAEGEPSSYESHNVDKFSLNQKHERAEMSQQSRDVSFKKSVM